MKLDSLNKKFEGLKNMEVLRIICVGRKYDPKLLQDKSREKIMDKLDTDFFIDLILEDNGKYTVVEFEY